MSDDVEFLGDQKPARLRGHVPFDPKGRRTDSIGTPLRSAFDDNEAEADPVPDEFVSLLHMMH